MDANNLQQRLQETGELMVVLESGTTYDLHTHTSEVNVDEGMVYTEGMRDGEYVVIEFPTAAIEHTYYHKEA